MSFVFDHSANDGPEDADLDDFLRSTWPHPNSGTLKIDAAVIDSGDGGTTDVVYGFCRPSWRDIAIFTAVVLVAGGIIYAALFIPRSKTNWGCGPEWDCRPRSMGAHGGPEPICLKK